MNRYELNNKLPTVNEPIFHDWCVGDEFECLWTRGNGFYKGKIGVLRRSKIGQPVLIFEREEGPLRELVVDVGFMRRPEFLEYWSPMD